MQSQYIVLTNSRATHKQGSAKLVVAGVVSLAAAAIATLCFYQGQPGLDSGLKFFGDEAHSEKQVAFMQFLAKYGKTYASKSDMGARFQTFSQNYDSIKAHNEAGIKRFAMGINQFSDMTIEEFQQLYGKSGVRPRKVESSKSERPVLTQSTLPESVDWHQKGIVTEPRDQGGCGSCWAFTTAATMESAFALKTGQAPERLSIQYLVDCDNVNAGCGGGWMLDAYEFTRNNGLVKENDYTSGYAARKEACRDDKSKERIKNDDQKEEDSITIERLKELVAVQPLGIAMHSNPSCLMRYSTGVLREADCHCSHAETSTVNHAVTLVGYGKTDPKENAEECPEYWKIRNSWGPTWGEKGYFRLCIPKDRASLPTGTCQVQSYVQWPLFKKQ